MVCCACIPARSLAEAAWAMLDELVMPLQPCFWQNSAKAFLLIIVSYVRKGGRPSVISSSLTIEMLAPLHITQHIAQQFIKLTSLS